MNELGISILPSTAGIQKVGLNEFRAREMDFYITELSTLRDSITRLMFNAHQNNFYQFVLYTAGYGQHQLDFTNIEYEPKMLIPVAKGQVQVMDGTEDSEAYIISFSEQFLYRYEADLRWLNHLNLFNLQRKQLAVKLDNDDFKNLQALIQQMKSEFHSPDPTLKKDIIRDLLRVFINFSERLFPDEEDSAIDYGSDYELYCNFKQALDENYKSCRSVKEYADMVFVTPKKLNQVTLKFGNKHAKKMIEDRLIMEIKRLLRYTNMNVKEIALDTGFSDITNFVKFFKRNVHVTPAKFNQSLQNGTF